MAGKFPNPERGADADRSTPQLDPITALSDQIERMTSAHISGIDELVAAHSEHLTPSERMTLEAGRRALSDLSMTASATKHIAAKLTTTANEPGWRRLLAWLNTRLWR